jgi:hypothetical protein
MPSGLMYMLAMTMYERATTVAKWAFGDRTLLVADLHGRLINRCLRNAGLHVGRLAENPSLSNNIANHLIR